MNKMRLNLDFDIVDGDTVRSISDYIDTRFFTQRKSFDEYYCDLKYINVNIDLGDLLILSESVKVTIENGEVYITDNC